MTCLTPIFCCNILVVFLTMSGQEEAATGQSGVEVLTLTDDSIQERMKHESMLMEMEIKKRAFSIDVPTLQQDVRAALRQLGQPVRLFGENLANVRDRLRIELARLELLKEGGASVDGILSAMTSSSQPLAEEEEEVTKYTRASQGLLQARDRIAKYSLERSKARLQRERRRRMVSGRKRTRLESLTPAEAPEEEAEISKLDEDCANVYKSLRNMALEGSQYGDPRALSAICAASIGGKPIVATGSWSATIKIWDAGSPQLDLLGETHMAHEDRIMGIAMQPSSDSRRLCASASIDLTGKLWRVNDSDDVMTDESKSLKYAIEEVAHLKGHQARLCCCAFHPTGDYLATTSFDHSWRLWDVETGGTEILLQDGHAKETYGVGFHPDGSLVASTDYAGVIQNWDLRTGKSVCHFLGHAKRVLCAEYSPNGFQLATAGDDGTIKIWDLRKRKLDASIPAHSNLITQISFSDSDTSNEYLVSSSFDGTAKLWSTRDWAMLATLRGHEGKVMGGCVHSESVVTVGYDRTLKMWK